MSSSATQQHIYDEDGDQLLVDHQLEQRIILVPDGRPTSKPDATRRIRIQWGQHLIDDLLAGRYRTLVCAVNPDDNSHGIISQLATLLPTSQWDAASITSYAKLFAARDKVSVLKYDLDAVEVLALLRPAGQDHLTLKDLAEGFHYVAEMVHLKPRRRPTASVSFLGAQANRLRDKINAKQTGISPAPAGEPSFETVLRVMYDAGFDGDVYPAPWMWESAPTAVFARFPFPDSLERMRQGGF